MNPTEAQLQTHLAQLKLAYVQEHYQSLADQAAQQHWTPVDYQNWLRIFNNDSTMTSAVLDRVLHHAETVPIEGKSYRMKDVIEEA